MRAYFAAAIAAVGAFALFDRPSDACFMRAPQPVQVVLDRIDVDVNDAVAVKHYDCHFANPNQGAIVGGVCYMEIEPGSQIDNMQMTVGGEKAQAELIDVEKANKIFQDIVKEGGNPALLEYYGNQLIRTQVPNVPAGGKAVVTLQYTQLLKPMNGVYRLKMLNTNPKMEMQVLQHAEINIKLKSIKPIKNVYSPTHDIKIDESVTDGIMVRWSQDNYLPKTPFMLYWATEEGTVGLSAIAQKEAGEPGHVMMMVSPSLGGVKEEDLMAKDIVFVADTSGSMVEGNKIDQLKGALKYCVEHLRKGDRFNIVDFSTTTRSFKDNLVEFNDDVKVSALRYIANLQARGGTAIEEALQTGLGQFAEDDGRLKMIFFATDGLPTIGERDADKLLELARNANKRGVRLFTFGQGLEVNSKLIDMLAYENRGESEYILPSEDIAKKTAAYFDKVGSPMLTDLKVTVAGSNARVFDVFPRQLPDLFRGDQVLIFGRYEGSGNVSVTLSGMVNGRERKFTYDVALPEESYKNEFVPRLWAGRKVEYLLNEVRKSNKDKELIDEIVKLAKQFGIVTPYTAYLATPDMAKARPGDVAGRLRAGFEEARRIEAQGTQGQPSAPAANAASDAASRLALLRDGEKGDMYKAADAERKARGQNDSVMNVMRYIGSKTFYRTESGWYDSTYDPEVHKDLKNIEFGGEDYYRLLGENTDLAKYFAMGDVIVRYKGVTYHVIKK